MPRNGTCLVVRREESLSYMLRAAVCLVKRVGSFSYTPPVGICLVVGRVPSFAYTPLAGISLVHKRLVEGGGEGSLTSPVLEYDWSLIG